MRRTIKLLDNAQATGRGAVFSNLDGQAAIQVVGATTAGAGSATIVIEVSNDGETWLPHDTVILTLSPDKATAGVELDARWAFVAANLTAINGTDAAVTTIMRAN